MRTRPPDLNRSFARLVQKSYEYIEPSLVPVCACGAVFLPLFFFVWRDVFPQPYENLTLRVIGAVLCLLLATHKLWPRRLAPAAPYLWYLALTYALPFFMTFMLLKNGSGVWLVTAIAGLLLVIVLADWANMIIINVTGTTAGFLFYLATDGTIGDAELYLQYVPVFGFALVAGSVFNYRREMLERAYHARERDLRRAKEDAEEASRAKSQFLATIGHELKTPLNAIIGFSELMKTEALGAIGNKKYLEYAQDIHSSGGHLLGVIDQILNLVKIESRRLELEVGDVDLGVEVEQALALAKAKPDSNDVEVTIRGVETAPPLRTDGGRLKQIMADLLANALKFTPEDGRVTLDVATCTPDLQITVEDTGIGISAEQLDKVFEPFQQADSALNRRYEGTGLGLSLSRSLAEHLGGTLALDSEVGHGTRATLTIPIALDSAKQIAAAA